MIIASSSGGMEVEEIADKEPESLVKTIVDPGHGLQDFQALLEREGDLRRAVQYLKNGVDGVDDPFDLLPGGTTAPSAS